MKERQIENEEEFHVIVAEGAHKILQAASGKPIDCTVQALAFMLKELDVKNRGMYIKRLFDALDEQALVCDMQDIKSVAAIMKIIKENEDD